MRTRHARRPRRNDWLAREEALEEATDVLHVLTSFESFDRLAGEERSLEDVVPVVYRVACTALGPGLRATHT